MEVLTTVRADEEGSIVIVATLSGTPLTFTWTLSDSMGNVINSRENVSATPSTTINIVLTGDDLEVSDSLDLLRVVTMKATYNSVTYGNGLNFTDEVGFYIDEYVAIP